jgi:hypothetical protein
MSKPAKVGGIVQISRKRYRVIERNGYSLDGWFFIEIEGEDGERHTAKSEAWRCGRGPWKIIAEAN